MHSTQVSRNWAVGNYSWAPYYCTIKKPLVSVLAQKFDCSQSHHDTLPYQGPLLEPTGTGQNPLVFVGHSYYYINTPGKVHNKLDNILAYSHASILWKLNTNLWTSCLWVLYVGYKPLSSSWSAWALWHWRESGCMHIPNFCEAQIFFAIECKHMKINLIPRPHPISIACSMEKR